MSYFPDTAAGQLLSSLPDAGVLGLSDADAVNRSGIDYRTTMASRTTLFRKTPAGSRTPTAFPATITLTAADHDKNVVLTGTTGVLTVDGTITDGFRCHVINNASGVATYSGITGLLSTTSLAAGLASTIMMAGATVYASAGGGSAPAIPVLTISSISGQAPGGTSTASLTFANGAPASLTATLDGAGLTIGSIVVTTTAGSGATASGTASFTFTTPAAGTHSIVATGTGTYSASSATYTLVTSSSPILTTTGVSPVGVGLTATATMSFANGAPTGLTATMDGGALTIAGVSITTTSGTGASATGTASFTFTNPAAGSHALVVTGTGTYSATAASYGYSTAALAITVNAITAPQPNTTIPVSGTFSNFTPSGLQYSTDAAHTTWTTDNSAVINANGTYTLSVVGGLPAGTYTVQVRGTVQTGTIGTSNSFTVAAVGGTITAPGTSYANTPASFPITITGSGNPSVWASITSGGVEGTRVQASYGATSVSLTPVNTTAGQTASLYAASSGGTALATSAAFTPAAAPTLLLDSGVLTSAPYAAFSLRKLRTGYTGAAIQAAIGTTGTVQDIGFDASGNFDTAGLQTFLNGAEGRIQKWYNQAAGGVDAVAVSATQRPQIAVAATPSTVNVIKAGGRAAPIFNGNLMQAPAMAHSATTLAATVVANGNNVAGGRLFTIANSGNGSNNTAGQLNMVLANGSIYAEAAGLNQGSNGFSANAPHVLAATYGGTTLQTIIDGGTPVSGTTGSTVSITTPSTLNIGAEFSGVYGVNGDSLAELILQPAINTTDLATVAANQKTYYGTP